MTNKKDKTQNQRPSTRKHLKSDNVFKGIMAEPLAAKELLEEYLPDNIKAIVDIDTVKVEKESYVEESLRRQFSDLVYTVKSKNTGENAFIYVLCEAQSSVDPLIAFRLWKYTLLLCERHIKGKKGKFPLVYPMVIYSGTEKYTAATNLWDLFEIPHVAKEIFTNDFKLVDLQSMPDDEIIRKNHLALLEYVMKHIKTRDTLQLWEDIFRLLGAAIEFDRHQDFFYIRRLLWYSDSRLPEDRQDDLNRLVMDNLSESEGTEIMRTIADKYIDEGIAIGEARGVAIGKNEGIAIGEARGFAQRNIQVATNMLRKNTDPKFVASVTGLSIDDILRLKNKL